MVARPHDYEYRATGRNRIGDRRRLVDVDPVLRRFGARKRVAREMYQKFIQAGMKLGHQDDLYRVAAGHVLGSDEFVDSVIHRISETGERAARADARESPDVNLRNIKKQLA